jgi:hypothetical protein
MGSVAPNPETLGLVPAGRRYRRSASFVPIALAGATGSSAGTLALMHTLTAAINVVLLTRLAQKAY